METQAENSGEARSVQNGAAEEKDRMTIGTQLRQARSEQKRSLSDVARETKIQGWVLEALEEDRLQEQMSPVYVKGLLTSYARALHLAPEPLLAQLTAPQPVSVQAALPPTPPPPPRSSRRPVSIHLPKFLTGRLGSALALSTCALALVFFTPVGGWISHQSTAALTAMKSYSARLAAARPPKPAPRKKIAKAAAPNKKMAKAVAPVRAAAPATAAAPSTSAPASTPSVAAAPTLAAIVPVADSIKPRAPEKPTTPPPLTLIPGKPLELQLNVQRTMWVRIRADGKLLAQQRLPRGTTERWTAKKVFQVVVASPAEAQLTLNGQSIATLLQAHQGRLLITHHGVTALPDD